jgi:hypothetical protein
MSLALRRHGEAAVDAVEIRDAQVIVQTDTSWLFRFKDREVWIPTDQILNRAEWQGRLRGRVLIPRALAQSLDLV